MPRIDIGDAEIQYESRGDGPPLMLVPGLGGSGSFWKNQIDEFAAHFRVVTHDHRGAGRSTHSRIAYSVDQMAADTLKLMDGLGIEAAHYAGHSTGGAIGQIIAQDAGHRLKSLVLSATWPGQDAYFNRCFEMRKLVLQTCGVLDYARISAINLWPAWWIAENDEELSRDNRAQAADHAPVEVMASRIDAIMAFCDSIDRLTVRVKDSPGFIVNRLLVPFIFDAIRMVESGIATAADVDQGCKVGLNHALGPLATADLIGLDTMIHISDAMFEEYGEARFKAPTMLRRLVSLGHLGRKSGRGFFEYDD